MSRPSVDYEFSLSMTNTVSKWTRIVTDVKYPEVIKRDIETKGKRKWFDNLHLLFHSWKSPALHKFRGKSNRQHHSSIRYCAGISENSIRYQLYHNNCLVHYLHLIDIYEHIPSTGYSLSSNISGQVIVCIWKLDAISEWTIMIRS